MASNRKAAEGFARYWAGRGDEKGETQQFWIDLLQNVLGDDDALRHLRFEARVDTEAGSSKGFADVTVMRADGRGALAMVEQKSASVDLDRPEQRQGRMVTPVQQCRAYAEALPFNEQPRWVLTCNFRAIRAYDRNMDPLCSKAPAFELALSDLPRNLDALSFLTGGDSAPVLSHEVSVQAGALMGRELLEEIVRIARSVDAYLLCDEVYRHLTQEDVWSESVADLYEKGISVSSMSKVFSLAGLRLGWIATHDEAALAAFRSHRDYDLISCGMFDEAVAAIALGHKDKLIARNTGIVRTNLAILDDWVSSSEHFFYTKPQAGTTALVYYDFDIPSYEFCTRMYHETGAFVTPGDCFEQPHSMRIGYASDTETLKAGLAAISEFAAKL